MGEGFKPPAPDLNKKPPSPERKSLTEIFMVFPGVEGGPDKVVCIPLLADGSAGLDEVPERYRTSWQTLGVRVFDGNLPNVMPAQGTLFLSALLSLRPSAYGPFFRGTKEDVPDAHEYEKS